MSTEDEKIIDRIESALLDGVVGENHPLHVLIGKHIREVHINGAHDLLQFTLADGETILVGCEGDCCSQSWFQSINDADDLHDATVSYAIHKEILWPGCDGEEEKVYGYMIATDKGYVDLVFRNSSNGYYGGSLVDGVHHHGVWDTKDARPVRGDWSA